MGCSPSIHKIQREFEQTKLKLDETIQNLKSANETIQNLELKFIHANTELEAAKVKLNEFQNNSMFNLPSMPPIPSIPSMFSSNQQNQEEQQIQNKDTESYFSTISIPSFFTPTSKPVDNDNNDQPSLSPSFINDLYFQFNLKCILL